MSLNPTCRTGPDDDCRQKVLASQKKRDAIAMPRTCGLGMEMGRNRASEPWLWKHQSSLVRVVEL